MQPTSFQELTFALRLFSFSHNSTVMCSCMRSRKHSFDVHECVFNTVLFHETRPRFPCASAAAAAILLFPAHFIFAHLEARGEGGWEEEDRRSLLLLLLLPPLRQWCGSTSFQYHPTAIGSSGTHTPLVAGKWSLRLPGDASISLSFPSPLYFAAKKGHLVSHHTTLRCPNYEDGVTCLQCPNVHRREK